MKFELAIRNRQRKHPVNLRLLRLIISELVQVHLGLEAVELGVSLVSAAAMTRLNWQFLKHAGSTDVITFDHTAGQRSRARVGGKVTLISGELFVCVDEAVAQSKRFRCTWQAEIIRYVVHGILHLCGHDDHAAGRRRAMKREEDRLVRALGKNFALDRLSR